MYKPHCPPGPIRGLHHIQRAAGLARHRLPLHQVHDGRKLAVFDERLNGSLYSTTPLLASSPTTPYVYNLSMGSFNYVGLKKAVHGPYADCYIGSSKLLLFWILGSGLHDSK